jgi:hypothetical protein
MKYNFLDLNEEIRSLMKEEVAFDLDNGILSKSTRFNDKGNIEYSDILLKNIENGDEETMSFQLVGLFKAKEISHDKKGNKIEKDIPSDANKNFANTEFNRFYMRALCVFALKNNKSLEIYRAKDSLSHRLESDNSLNTKIENVQETLMMLRDNKEYYNFIAKPNSGLSLKII